MNKTKTKKVLSMLAVGAIATTQLASVFAAPSTIGTGIVTGDASFDTNIIWDGNFPGTASGTISGIKVNAQVAPTLNTTFSAKEINLGLLTAGVTASGSIDIEVGTNAANGVTITAQSASGGLTNTSNASLQINSLTTDGTAESYTFESAKNLEDSTVAGFASNGDYTAAEMNNTTPVVIYNTNKPELTELTNADVTFKVSATSNAQTAAGDYQDTLNFVVTGNF